jgi:hypothetical protein
MTVTPVNLFASEIRLRQGGQVHAEQRTFDSEQDDWRLTAFHMETDAEVHADHWEAHDAEEDISCLTCTAGRSGARREQHHVDGVITEHAGPP